MELRPASPLRGWRVRCGVVALALWAAMIAAGCSSSNHPGASQTTVKKNSGSVLVLYPPALEQVMASRIGPAFYAATGYSFDGLTAPTSQLAAQVIDGARQGDVFVSDSAMVDSTLTNPANGGWSSWYATFATRASTAYTVTILSNAPDNQAGVAFVRYLLGAKAAADIRAGGFLARVPAELTGTGVPVAVSRAVSG